MKFWAVQAGAGEQRCPDAAATGYTRRMRVRQRGSPLPLLRFPPCAPNSHAVQIVSILTQISHTSSFLLYVTIHNLAQQCHLCHCPVFHSFLLIQLSSIFSSEQQVSQNLQLNPPRRSRMPKDAGALSSLPAFWRHSIYSVNLCVACWVNVADYLGNHHKGVRDRYKVNP